MLSHACLDKEFWVEAINTACWLVNRPPNISTECKTQEVWSGKLGNYSTLWVFECLAYAHVNDGKVELERRNASFLGSFRCKGIPFVVCGPKST